jgi:hypothetical protein
MADRHPGITMHKLSFGGGFIGLLFAAGSALIFVLGFPTLWYFVAFAFGLGVAIAVLLNFVSDRRDERNRPLSIMSVSAPAEVQPRGQQRPKTLHRIFPRVVTT